MLYRSYLPFGTCLGVRVGIREFQMNFGTKTPLWTAPNVLLALVQPFAFAKAWGAIAREGESGLRGPETDCNSIGSTPSCSSLSHEIQLRSRRSPHQVYKQWFRILFYFKTFREFCISTLCNFKGEFFTWVLLYNINPQNRWRVLVELRRKVEECHTMEKNLSKFWVIQLPRLWCHSYRDSTTVSFCFFWRILQHEMHL